MADSESPVATPELEKGEKDEIIDAKVINESEGVLEDEEDIKERNLKLGKKIMLVDEMSVEEHGKMMKSFQSDSNFWPIDVSFKNLTFEVKVPVADPGTNNNLKALFNMLNSLAFNICGAKKRKRQVLSNLSGVFRAGTTTVVLGPRGSGVTTFFKSLSDLISSKRNAKLSGEVRYSGYEKSELLVRKFCGYVDQNDIHISTLTVKETLNFAFKCFGAHKKVYGQDIDKIYPDSNISSVLKGFVSFVTQMFGLNTCENTIIGDELTRGVSGGEKHRVTTAEIVLGRKPLMFFDQISTGLDSAATFDIVKDLKTNGRLLQNTYIFSLLQPSPEVYELFDEVLILADGMILFHDARENVIPFFDSIGYECPPSKDIADFIQEVTTDMRQKYLNNGKVDQTLVPKTNAEIAQAWEDSEFARKKAGLLEEFHNSNRKESNATVDAVKVGSTKFCTDWWSDFMLVVSRERKLFYRNKKVLRARGFQSFVMGTILGTVFLNLDTDLLNPANVQQRFGLVFFIAMQAVFAGFAMVPLVFETREVFYKQTGLYFHRVFTYCLATNIVAIPFILLEALILSSLTFWLADIVPAKAEGAVETFGLMVGVLTLVNVVISGFLRFIASATRNYEAALAIIALTMAMMILLSGFIITQDNMPPWFIWIYWVSPLSYAIRSLVLGIFSARAFSEEEQLFAKELFGLDDFGEEFIWYGIGYLIGFAFLNVILTTIALSVLRYDSSGERREAKSELDLIDEQKKDKKPSKKKKAPAGGVKMSTEVGELLQTTKITPVTLVFKDLWYTIPPKKRGQEPLQLLKGITGYACPGTMTALMGSTGAGKTTLMDVIAGRKTSGKVNGEILVNGQRKTKAFAGIMGYVEQMDVHSPHQTIEEAIMFSARLRQRGTTYKEKKEFLETVLDTLELQSIRKFEIGLRERGGISPEQAKRLTIAVELAANPSVLFLDEPTSGLDSRAADVIMRGIKRVAQSGRTVVCTIHQPNRSIFEAFDKVLLLKRGGQTVYFGDLGENSEHLVDYLESIPGTQKLPNQRYNPANYMLDVIGAGTSSAQNAANIDFAQTYVESELFAENEERIAALLEESSQIDFKFGSLGRATGYFTQQKLLIIKTFSSFWRNPNYILARNMLVILMGVLWGTMFYRNADPTFEQFDQGTIISVVGVMFTSTTFMGAISPNLGLNPLAQEKAAFIRERSSRMYTSLPYAIANLLAEIPYVTLIAFEFTAILTYLIGIDVTLELFLEYTAYIFLFLLAMTYFGHMLTALTADPATASIFAGLLVGMSVLFSGFLIARDDVTPFWQFMTYVVPSRYILNGLANLVLQCDCNALEVAEGVCLDNSVGCTLIFNQQFQVNQTAWDVALAIYGFDEDYRLFDMLALGGFALFFGTMSFIGYVFFSKPKR